MSNIFQDRTTKKWWYVWSGYTIGPWASEEEATKEYNRTKEIKEKEYRTLMEKEYKGEPD